MRKFTLENYEDSLAMQVVFMDQAVCYCPEYRATRKLHDYPSRKTQLARAVFKSELEGNEYISKILFNSILSGQGERWQNFGESPEDFTDVLILSREMMVKKGFEKKTTEELTKILADNQTHLVKQTSDLNEKWKRSMPVSDKSSVYLMLDDATYAYCSESADLLGEFFKRKQVSFYTEICSTFVGWEYFAYGLIEQGEIHIAKMIADLELKGIDTIVTLSGQSQYVLDKFAKKLGLLHHFKIISVLDYCTELRVTEPVYLYAGSFYARFLNMCDKLNRLVVNSTEVAMKECAEFTPLMVADKRINKVTVWQKPITSEYLLLGIDEHVSRFIEKDAISDIEKGSQKRTVIFDPHAYQVLKNVHPELDIVYYLDILD